MIDINAKTKTFYYEEQLGFIEDIELSRKINFYACLVLILFGVIGNSITVSKIT